LTTNAPATGGYGPVQRREAAANDLFNAAFDQEMRKKKKREDVFEL
jgi:hypothetical protein